MPFRLRPGWQRVAAAVALAGASLSVGAAAGSIFLITARDSWSALAAPGPAGPADGILLVAGMGGALLALWIALAITLTALSTLPGVLGQVCRELAARIAPTAVRKTVAFILGTTLTAALVPGNAVAGVRHEARRHAATSVSGPTLRSVADAAPDASFRHLSDPVRDRPGKNAAPRPEWSPDGPRPRSEARPTFGDEPTSHTRLRPPHVPASESGLKPAAKDVIVHRADTLWSIAARHLGPGATPGDIDAEWRRWHATNRAVIGSDANLILPGQRLRPPTDSQVGS